VALVRRAGTGSVPVSSTSGPSVLLVRKARKKNILALCCANKKEVKKKREREREGERATVLP